MSTSPPRSACTCAGVDISRSTTSTSGNALPLGAQQPGDDVVGRRPDRGDGDASDLPTARAAYPVDGTLGLEEEPAPFVEQRAPRRGEPHLPARPLEQEHAEPALESLDLLAQPGLRHAQARGGAAEVQLLGDRDEVADQSQVGMIHNRALSIGMNNLFA